MSEASPEDDAGRSFRRQPVRLSGADDAGARHAMMLHRCFNGAGTRWSDALIARTRRNAGGGFVSAELGLRMEIAAHGPGLAALVDALPEALCWKRAQVSPDLIAPPLLSRFRDQAAIGLMQQDGFLKCTAESDDPAPPFPEPMADMLAAIALAQASWADGRADDAPARLDMPAEPFADLIWTASAILAEALCRTDTAPAIEMLALVERAAAAMIARHEEEAGPYALAERLAQHMRGMALGPDHLVALARGRQPLALLAIAADRLRIALPVIVGIAVEGDEQTLLHLCRAADFPREVAVRLVLGRRCVARGVDDSMLVDYADHYDQLAHSRAAAAITGWGLAPEFRAKLGCIGMTGIVGLTGERP